MPRQRSVSDFERNAISFSDKTRHNKLNRLFLLSAWRFKTERVEKLLDAGANIEAHPGNGWTALFQAAYIGDVKTAMMLIGRGARLDKRDGSGNFVDDYGVAQLPDAMNSLPTSLEERKAFLKCLRLFRTSTGRRGIMSFFSNFKECASQ